MLLQSVFRIGMRVGDARGIAQGHALHRAAGLALLTLASVLAGWMSGGWSFATVVFLSALAAWILWSEIRERRRLNRLSEEGAKLLPEDEPVLDSNAEPVARLTAVYDRLLAQLEAERGLLREEVRRRARAEEALRESEQRYTLALSGANDGMWEWNLKTGAAEFSPRWWSMLGHTEPDVGGRIEQWHSRIHPNDRANVLSLLQAHIDGNAPRFESEHRIRQKDGGYRWVLARAAAVRHANGKPYRVVGLNTDISARKQVQQTLLELADGLSDLRGDETYRALVEKFASIVGTREAYLCECVDFPATRVRMLAYWYHGGFAPNLEFDLAATPCEEVVCNGRPLFVPHGLPERFPAVTPLGVESYLGLPCVDTRGTVIGHMVCKDSVALTREIPHAAILKLFAVRASVELERRLLERVRHTALGAARSSTLH